MALRDFGRIPYIPLLELRPAEMVALESLPEKDKDLMLPVLRLRPWVSANRISSSMTRLHDAYKSRPAFLLLADAEVSLAPREVHAQLEALRVSDDGYAAWCNFIQADSHHHFIPSLQLTNPDQFDAQTTRLSALNRGLLVHVESGAFPFLDLIAARTAALTNGGTDVVFMLDYGRQSEVFLLRRSEIVARIQRLRAIVPNAYVGISASSFPDSFTTIVGQDIFERALFNQVRNEIGGRLIYSDRGSARAERQSGGGGTPAPRIDFVAPDKWHFFRDDTNGERVSGYERQARNVIASPVWDARLKLWGTQMIERTALGDSSAITSPSRSTAARINIHLHQQLYYGDAAGLYDTDEDWSD